MVEVHYLSSLRFFHTRGDNPWWSLFPKKLLIYLGIKFAQLPLCSKRCLLLVRTIIDEQMQMNTDFTFITLSFGLAIKMIASVSIEGFDISQRSKVK